MNIDKSAGTVSIPRYLFRYVRDDDNLLDTLSTPYLWFTSRESLNDPFDLTNVLEINSSDEDLIWYMSKYIPKPLADKVSNVPLEFLADKEKRKSMVNSMKHILASLHKIYMESIGLCCFSFDNNSSLMWSHYGGSHKGVCMVVDTKNFISEFSLIKVDYKENLSKWNMIESRKKWGNTMDYQSNFDQVVLGTKYKNWSYENEYRLISRKTGKHILYPEALLGVIFGSKMKEERKNQIKERLVTKNSNLKFVDSSLELSTGEIKVSDFKNEMDTLKISGWRTLDDPKGQYNKDFNNEK